MHSFTVPGTFSTAGNGPNPLVFLMEGSRLNLAVVEDKGREYTTWNYLTINRKADGDVELFQGSFSPSHSSSNLLFVYLMA